MCFLLSRTIIFWIIIFVCKHREIIYTDKSSSCDQKPKLNIRNKKNTSTIIIILYSFFFPSFLPKTTAPKITVEL